MKPVRTIPKPPKLPNGVEISEVKVIYSQESDSNEESVGQELTIEKTDAGDGKYFIISTRRWAFDTIEDLISLIKNVT